MDTIYKVERTIGRTKCGVNFAVVKGPWFPAEYYGGAIQNRAGLPRNNETSFYKRNQQDAEQYANELILRHMKECASCKG